MESWMIGAIAGGVGAAIATGIAASRARKTAVDLVPILQQQGPMTLEALMEKLGMKGLSKQGQLMQALDQLRREGKVAVEDAPAGTPRMQRMKKALWRATS